MIACVHCNKYGPAANCGDNCALGVAFYWLVREAGAAAGIVDPDKVYDPPVFPKPVVLVGDVIPADPFDFRD